MGSGLGSHNSFVEAFHCSANGRCYFSSCAEVVCLISDSDKSTRRLVLLYHMDLVVG